MTTTGGRRARLRPMGYGVGVLAAMAVVGAACALASCAAPSRPASPRAHAPAGAEPTDAGPLGDASSGPPRTVVAIVVDQLAAWTIEERFAALPAAGGFHRLAREGTWTTLLYDHALTDTAPGHAALFTGEPPVRSGIFGNAEPVDVPGGTKLQSLLVDPTTTLLAPPGGVTVPPGTPGVSARRLRAATVASALAERTKGARVAAFSLKDRGAVLPAGAAPADVVFFEGRLGGGGFVTSSAYGPAFPPSVAAVAAKAGRWPTTWTPLDAAWLAKHADGPDDDPSEGAYDGLGRAFPHPVKTAGAFRASPFGNAALVEAVARVARRHEGRARAPAHGLVLVVRHRRARLRTRLPRSLGRTPPARPGPRRAVRRARRHVGRSGRMGRHAHGRPRRRPEPPAPRSVRPTAGAASRAPPTAWGHACGAGERLDPNAVREAIRKDLAARKLDPKLLREVVDSWIWLAPEVKALSDAQRHELDHAVRGVVARLGKGAFETVDARSLATACGAGAAGGGGDALTELLCNTMAEGAGDYYLVPKPGSYVDPGIVPGFGSSHGSPWRYDPRRPPVRAGPPAPRRAPASRTTTTPRHAAVLRALLGLEGSVPEALREAAGAR